MSGHLSGHRAANRPAEKVKIYEYVENLMAGKFIGIAQIGIDNLVIADDDAVIELAAARQTHGLEFLDIAQETEGARGRDFGFKIFWSLVDVKMFLLANRLGVAQHIMNREHCGGFDADRLPALGAQMIRPDDNDFAPFFFFFMNACFL